MQIISPTRKCLKAGVICIVVLAFTPVFAQDTGSLQLVPLAPLPYTVEGPPGSGTTLSTYVPGLFKLSLGFAAVLAVVMMIIGGLEWMLTDSVTNKSEGRRRIAAALGGLLLLLSSFLILQQISPDLVNFNLDIPDVKVASKFGDTDNTPPSGEPRLIADYEDCDASKDSCVNTESSCIEVIRSREDGKTCWRLKDNQSFYCIPFKEICKGNLEANTNFFPQAQLNAAPPGLETPSGTLINPSTGILIPPFGGYQGPGLLPLDGNTNNNPTPPVTPGPGSDGTLPSIGGGPPSLPPPPPFGF
jgi:hypothetical protein